MALEFFLAYFNPCTVSNKLQVYTAKVLFHQSPMRHRDYMVIGQ